ncbi:uncharacterized protein LOC111887229 [Lactuca sativa]|uniref:uncharacterized protein LOC111887229 n=1 Tax=Lactuca sativa TaxID=4236 RepID=UPI000CD9F8AC|nr:uncharacterized protein LOC111887229 [Lactuca sativa]
MEALEFMDFDMLDVINKGPIVAMHKSSNDGAFGSKLKGKYFPGYNKEEKRMMSLDFKTVQMLKRRWSLYHLVLNRKTPQMMKGKEHNWYLDSGCLRHMTGFKSVLEGFIKKDGQTITYGDNVKGVTKGHGYIKCNFVVFKNVSYVKVLQHNLISISQVHDTGYEVLFNKIEGQVVD